VFDASEWIVCLVQYSVHPVVAVRSGDDRDDLMLGYELALGLDLVQDAANRHQDVCHIGAAAVVRAEAVAIIGESSRAGLPDELCWLPRHAGKR
jgi:hypothetical protein